MRALILVALAITACGGDGGDGTTPGGACDEPAGGSGDGTYYDATGAGNCSFDATPNDLMVAAMNAVDYGTADWCGACVAVQGPNGSAVVRIVDQCPECAKGALDLSPQAFAMLSPLEVGRIPITWHEVACNVSGPIEYHFKDGANPYWFAVQIRNHRYPITTVDAKDSSGAYQPIERLEYNYFVYNDGLGPGPYALRVTDDHGHIVEDDGIALGDNVTRTGSAQLAACP